MKESKRRIEFNPGHRQEMEKFLNPGENTISVKQLLTQTTTPEDIELAIFGVHQELGNAAMMIDVFEFLIEDLVITIEALSAENIEKAVSHLESFVHILTRGTDNADAIIEFLKAIEARNIQALQNDEPSILTAKTKEYILIMTEDYTLIEKILSEKGDEYTRVYKDALMKVNQYLRDNK